VTEPDPFVTPLERDRIGGAPTSAWTLPPRAYVDHEVWDREVAAIFRHDWVCVARSSQLPGPGDYVAVELIDQPVLLIRDDDGTIQALSNVCLHRSMPLVSGAGSTRWIVCPYHLWSYGRDGRLHTAPMMEGADEFESDRCRLPRLAVEEWCGFVFVSMDDEPSPLAPQLAGLDSIVEPYGLGDLVIADTLDFDSPWNWKLLVENFMEAYHHIGPHRDTFERSNPARDSFVVDNHRAPWSLLHMPGVAPLDDGTELPYLSGLDPERRADLLAACVYPTLLFAVTGTLATWYEVVPHSHDRPRRARGPAGDPHRSRVDPRRGHPGERRPVARAPRAAGRAGPPVAVRSGHLAVQPVLAVEAGGLKRLVRRRRHHR
jgi:phenylpropionate dioxygenase-like ring-hydroxylating dioxygenase large terminal subunit